MHVHLIAMFFEARRAGDTENISCVISVPAACQQALEDEGEGDPGATTDGADGTDGTGAAAGGGEGSLLWFVSYRS